MSHSRRCGGSPSSGVSSGRPAVGHAPRRQKVAPAPSGSVPRDAPHRAPALRGPGLRGRPRAAGAGDRGCPRRRSASIPAGLVTACRRIIDRHPASGPLWWLSAQGRSPSAIQWGRPGAAADEIDDDPTARRARPRHTRGGHRLRARLARAIGDALPRRGDVEVLVVDALGEGSGLVRRLQRADVDAIDVPMSGLGARSPTATSCSSRRRRIGPGGCGRCCRLARGGRGGAPRRHAGVGRGWGRPGAAGPHVGGAGAALDDDEPVGAPTTTSSRSTCVDVIVGPKGALPLADALRRIDCPMAPELFKPTT